MHMTEMLQEIAVDQLMPDPTQPRKTFPPEEIERLAASIRARGLLQPLRVMPDAQRSRFVIVTGESRFRAGQLVGLTALPCLVLSGQPEEADLLADRIVENHVRHDLRPLELARALAKLKALKQCTSRELACELGLSASAITRAEALLTLPEAIQAQVDAGAIPESIAYEISRHPDASAQLALAEAVAKGRMRREAVTEAVRRTVGKRNIQPKAARLACRLEGGVALTLTSSEPLTWDTVLTTLDRIRREAKRLAEGGKDPSALAAALRAS